VGDQADSEAKEWFVDVVASFPAIAQARQPWSHAIVRSTT
jgi:hypothetical protein